MKKITLALIFGGRSAEHEVSIQSAKSVLAAIDTKKYQLIFIGIAKDGRWYLLPEKGAVAFLKDVAPGTPLSTYRSLPKSPMAVDVMRLKKDLGIDVAFTIMHGPMDEDGTIQALLKIANIPFVGSNVLSAGIAMDKDVSKRLFHEAGIQTARALTYQSHEAAGINYAKAKKVLGLPMFIKPANMGSSVGVAKVRNQKEFLSAIKAAFTYDVKIIIEEGIVGREIECAILGSEKPSASLPGEVIAQQDFYSYDAKYISTDGAQLKIPAELSKTMIVKIQKLALKAYKALGCEGMARVDFFLKKNGGLIVNEINTIPGFVSGVSMYPVLWQASGLTYSKLIDRLVKLALERYAQHYSLK
jgi:D-alanine-D-alanine ligase